MSSFLLPTAPPRRCPSRPSRIRRNEESGRCGRPAEESSPSDQVDGGTGTSVPEFRRVVIAGRPVDSRRLQNRPAGQYAWSIGAEVRQLGNDKLQPFATHVDGCDTVVGLQKSAQRLGFGAVRVPSALWCAPEQHCYRLDRAPPAQTPHRPHRCPQQRKDDPLRRCRSCRPCTSWHANRRDRNRRAKQDFRVVGARRRALMRQPSERPTQDPSVVEQGEPGKPQFATGPGPLTLTTLHPVPRTSFVASSSLRTCGVL